MVCTAPVPWTSAPVKKLRQVARGKYTSLVAWPCCVTGATRYLRGTARRAIGGVRKSILLRRGRELKVEELESGVVVCDVPGRVCVMA